MVWGSQPIMPKNLPDHCFEPLERLWNLNKTYVLFFYFLLLCRNPASIWLRTAIIRLFVFSYKKIVFKDSDTYPRSLMGTGFAPCTVGEFECGWTKGRKPEMKGRDSNLVHWPKISLHASWLRLAFVHTPTWPPPAMNSQMLQEFLNMDCIGGWAPTTFSF